MVAVDATQSTLVDIVIVTWNSEWIIGPCLDHILASMLAGDLPAEAYQITILDNASADATVQRVEDHTAPVRLIRYPENLGYAAGNNVVFDETSAPYVLLLNPDAYLDNPATLPNLLAFLQENQDIAAAAPRLLNVDGSHQVGDGGYRLSLWHAFTHALFLSKIFPSVKGLYLNAEALQGDRVVYPDWLCGACMLVRREVINEVGGFNEDIILYSEDLEWGERMRRKGLTLAYLPWVTATHLQGATQREVNTNSPMKPYVSTKWLASKLQILRRQRGRVYTLAFRLIMLLGFLLRAGCYSIKRLLQPANASFAKAKADAMWLYAKFMLVGK